jgi:hypothetical protein
VLAVKLVAGSMATCTPKGGVLLSFRLVTTGIGFAYADGGGEPVGTAK